MKVSVNAIQNIEQKSLVVLDWSRNLNVINRSTIVRYFKTNFLENELRKLFFVGFFDLDESLLENIVVAKNL
jgi:hypothetical protein